MVEVPHAHIRRASREHRLRRAHIAQQRGMFSYSGLTAEQVARLQKEDSIFALSTGRICVAALNTKNIDRVAKAIARVLA